MASTQPIQKGSKWIFQNQPENSILRYSVFASKEEALKAQESLLKTSSFEDEDEDEDEDGLWEHVPSPEWDKDTQEWHTQRGRGGLFSSEPANYSTSKTAVDWSGPMDRVMHREDRYREKQVSGKSRELVNTMWFGIKKELSHLKSTFLVKPGKHLGDYNLSSLFNSSDPDEKRAGYKLRSLIYDYLVKQYTPDQIETFKKEEGSNVTDWLMKSQYKRASSLLRRAKTRYKG